MENNYWIITLQGGSKVIATNKEFNKISPEIYLSAMRLDSLEEVIMMLHKLTVNKT